MSLSFNLIRWSTVCVLMLAATQGAGQESSLTTADLLIVGGTESGCAAAIQAARMGVERIVLVSDTTWLGGQFTAESLVAIDENRGPEGYGHGVPFPRNGLFREVIDRIETLNRQTYGKSRPGNTRVITTCRPSDSRRVFEDLLAPFEDQGQITVLAGWYPVEVFKADGTPQRVTGVRFTSDDGAQSFTVEAKLTIDATDWGDVVRGSGNAYLFGPDLRGDFGEPLAPLSRDGYPLTDMNPITYCLLLEKSDESRIIPRPAGYDPRHYRDHGYPKDPMWLYESRRIIDATDPQVDSRDVVLLCFPAFDYPLDAFPASVAAALEATEKGASRKNIVQLNRQQREIIFEDAERYSLGFLYYLQTEVAAQYPEHAQRFRLMRLVDEFATSDHLPPKPYIRESLRTRAMYMMRQQDSTGFGGRAENFAQVMYHDGVGCWQFEYDFHPTRRVFLNGDPSGPWKAGFREGRTWGPPYSGRSLLAARSLIPDQTDGLLVAQKNLGFTSLISSALRLHDQSMMVGQAAGAVAAIALSNDQPVRTVPMTRRDLDRVWRGLCSDRHGAMPVTLWPFADLEPSDPSFCAVNLLAAHRASPLTPLEIEFRTNAPATSDWQTQLVELSLAHRKVTRPISIPTEPMTRGQFANWWWNEIKDLPLVDWQRDEPDDADSDSIVDVDDPLPFDSARTSWSTFRIPPKWDGVPSHASVSAAGAFRINFGGATTPPVDGWMLDSGAVYSEDSSRGWKRDVRANQRDRGKLDDALRDTFLFTRSHDVWELTLDPGRYEVTVCIGDSAYDQVGQNVTIEGETVFRDLDTQGFREETTVVNLVDGKLTIEIGRPGGTTNTCLNWCLVVPTAIR